MALNPFTVVEPITIDDTRYNSTLNNIGEPTLSGDPLYQDPPLWNAVTAYTAGQRATYVTPGTQSASGHMIYQRLISGTTATAPNLDATNWVAVKSDNRWAMFDGSNSTQTGATGGFSFYLFLTNTEFADTLIFDNVYADNIRVTIFDPNNGMATLYDSTINLKVRSCRNWYDYFFNQFRFAPTAVFTNLPRVSGVWVAVSVTKVNDTGKVGTCVIGRAKVFGFAQPGAQTGIVDYSTKTTDAFGNTTVVQRAFSKRMALTLLLDNTQVDEFVDFCAKYRTTLLMWLGAGSTFSSLVMYGYYKSFETIIAYPTQSQCNLEIESAA